MKQKHDIFFIIILSTVFVFLAVVFCFFPRSTFSELERRELKKFPDFSIERLRSGDFTKDISEWFSDSEPFRDVFMSLNMEFKRRLALSRSDEDAVTFHASSSGGGEDAVPGADDKDFSGDRNISEVAGIGADEVGKLADAGIIIAGSGPQARALMIFGGSGKGPSSYAETLNFYRDRLPSSVRIYAMVIPTAIEFYCPEKVKKHTNSELATIRNIYSQLNNSVTAVDVYTPLGKHAAEPIFLRTDHHWAPLGAYYAAEKLAQVADVPFKPLSEYNKKMVRNFVGTMYGYSKDVSIKNAPEDFIYYTPKDSSYVTTFIDFDLDKDFRIIKEYAPRKGKFFQRYKDGSSAAYSTFMGGDRKIVTVKTGVKNNRKLLIIKDSFGNALPGYFFYSFGEVHVVDFRFFNRNLAKYLSDNHITDVVVALNIFNAYSSSVNKKIKALLQSPGVASSSASSPNGDPQSKSEISVSLKSSSSNSKTDLSSPQKETQSSPKTETVSSKIAPSLPKQEASGKQNPKESPDSIQ